MMRQTGGTDVGATSTRSYPVSWACLNASGVGRIPSCSPSGPITRTSRTLISRFTRSLGTIGHLSMCGLKILGLSHDLLPEVFNDAGDAHAAQVGSVASTHRHGSTLNFPVAGHQHERDFGFLGFPDFEPDLFVAQIRLRSEASGFQLCHNTGDIVPLIIGDREYGSLNGSEPGRECAAKMLDQNAEEALDGAHQCSVNHNRLMHLTIFTDVPQFKPFGIIEVDLDRGTLP